MRLPITLLLLAAPLAAADAVITSRGQITALEEEDARDLMLGRRTTWKDGTQAVVVMVQDAQQPALERLAKRSSSQVMQTWKRLVFTGKSSMPRQAADEAAVVAAVAATPGSIAVVDQAAVTADVVVLLKR